jgi:hypothetical protein
MSSRIRRKLYTEILADLENKIRVLSNDVDKASAAYETLKSELNILNAMSYEIRAKAEREQKSSENPRSPRPPKQGAV